MGRTYVRCSLKEGATGSGDRERKGEGRAKDRDKVNEQEFGFVCHVGLGYS